MKPDTFDLNLSTLLPISTIKSLSTLTSKISNETLSCDLKPFPTFAYHPRKYIYTIYIVYI